MKLQAFSQPLDLRNLSCNDSVPRGNLWREVSFIITVPWHINTLSRWEKWIRRIVLTGLLKSSSLPGTEPEHFIATLPLACLVQQWTTYSANVRKTFFHILKAETYVDPGDQITQWWKRKIFGFFCFKWVGQYPVVFGIKRRMSRKKHANKFWLDRVFWFRSELELINQNQYVTCVCWH